MIEALERETRLAEQRRDFVETALASRAEFARDQSGYAADEVHAYFAARVKDKPVSRPRARRWRR